MFFEVQASLCKLLSGTFVDIRFVIIAQERLALMMYL